MLEPIFPTRLIEGYKAFLTGRMPLERDRFHALAERGQSPGILVIGCCDSRVSPEVIFDAHPGELFVVRNVANLVPRYTADGMCHGVFAALEFAVQVLRVGHIVGTLVLCGAWFDVATGQVLVRTPAGYVDAGELLIGRANSP
jgi:carbonic anhydrase